MLASFKGTVYFLFANIKQSRLHGDKEYFVMHLWEDCNQFPKSILERIDGQTYTVDTIGESGGAVLLFDSFVLKIEKTNENANHEIEALRWLENRLPVPKIIAFAQENGFNYILMSKLKGTMACDCFGTGNVDDTIAALADGLKKLWRIDISDCPLDSSLPKRLAQAKRNIENGLVDVDDFEPNTVGADGFSDIDALYDSLTAHQPDVDLVFTHGDYCLPNIFTEKDKTVGLVDLGKAGVADRWQDIALCVRSLHHNLCGPCGVPYSDFLNAKNRLYAELGITENTEKLKYYILLDELF